MKSASQNRFTTRHARRSLELYRQGLSCRRVAELLRREFDPAPSQQWIFERVQEAGLLRSKSRAMELREARRHGKDYDTLRAVARRLAEEKLWSVRRIAIELGVGKSVVKRCLDANFVLNPSEATLRRKWQAYHPDVELRRELRDHVARLRESGRKLREIVAATGLSLATVTKYLREAGLTRPIARPRPRG